ncbi:MAG: ABC transporter substrate-binding protein, partial [Trebonia sp.]
VAPDAIGEIKAAQAQGWNDVTWLLLSSVYTQQFANAVTHAGKGVYLPAEFTPYTDPNNAATQDWRALMMKNKIPLTAFSEGGYLAATYFVDVLKGMKGDITKESVTKALKSMQPISNPMSGSPYVFGPGKTHNSNATGWPVKLLSGTQQWQSAAKDWLHVPAN